MSNGKTWTTAEDDILREFYPIEGHECAERLGRTQAAVHTRAKQLRLRRYDLLREHPWTAEEDAIMREYAFDSIPNTAAALVDAGFRRTVLAVKCRRAVLARDGILKETKHKALLNALVAWRDAHRYSYAVAKRQGLTSRSLVLAEEAETQAWNRLCRLSCLCGLTMAQWRKLLGMDTEDERYETTTLSSRVRYVNSTFRSVANRVRRQLDGTEREAQCLLD